jgi:integrase
MARKIGKLSALAVARAKQPGLYHDGSGLYLQVTPSGGKSWLFRFTLNGRSRGMGLGPLEVVPLAEARIQAAACRRLLWENVDPIEARKARRVAAQLDAANAMTFRECAEAYIAAHRDGWRNAKHAGQWVSTLATYAHPVFGSLPVQQVDVPLVMRVLGPIWSTRGETASRVRGRIEVVLDWATTRGYRRGENPARWKGHLENLLPRRSKRRRVKHHPALPYRELGAFMLDLRAQESIGARALEFTILTAARTGEVTGARIDELDSASQIWTVPAGRTKGEREHRIPLSESASAIVQHLSPFADPRMPSGFLFPGINAGKPLSANAMRMVLVRMGRGDITVHGFRSTFRDWCAEQTSYPREVAEMALAHAVESKVEGAYRRGDLLEKRRRLMDDWARFCAMPAPAAEVVPLRQTGG